MKALDSMTVAFAFVTLDLAAIHDAALEALARLEALS